VKVLKSNQLLEFESLHQYQEGQYNQMKALGM